MGRSIPIAKVKGIEIRAHFTFALVLIWAALDWGVRQGLGLAGALYGVVFISLLFVAVTLHELGHSLIARRFGAKVRDITLLPIGGVARLDGEMARPRHELWMAVAGPAVNVALAAVLGAIAVPVLGWRALGGLGVLLERLNTIGPERLLVDLFVANLGLALFNLLPAFPMDGGRVLRAILGTVMSHARATALAVGVGQGLAWLFGLAGLLTGNLMWILVAIFVYSGASQEGRMIQVRNALQGLQVRQAFSRHAQVLSPDDPISRAADLTLESFQADFPICDGERIVGLLTHTDVIRALKQRRPETPVRQVMQTEFPTVGLNDGLFEIQQQMAETGLGALPVIEKGHFLGLLTRRDVNEVYHLLSVSPELLAQRRGT